MDINSTISFTDKVLGAVGIARADVVLVIFILVVSTIGYLIVARFKCGKTLSCERTEQALQALESMSKKVDHLHSTAVETRIHMNTLKDSHSIFDTNLADIKADMSLLQGIIMGINAGTQNRRIIHG